MSTPAKLAMPLPSYFDHTLLSPYAVRADFERVAEECRRNKFRMMAINSSATCLCRELLDGSGVHVGAAVSFPLGQTTIETKAFETRDAIQNGADEIDYVVNLGKLKEGNLDYIREEMARIVTLCMEHCVISKVIFETCYLTDEEIEALCAVAREVGPDFVKTSTGFGTAGATVEHVALMKRLVGSGIKVKASGGIRDLDSCLAMIDAGAERIGSSNSVAIVEEYNRRTAEII